MKNKITLLILSIITSCGDVGISPELQEDLSYLEEALGISVSYDMRIGPLDGAAAARCYRYPVKRVVIDIEKIKAAGDSLRLVMLHEIGHCSFDVRGHEETSLKEVGCPTHIMESSNKQIRCEKYIGQYISQLKNN